MKKLFTVLTGIFILMLAAIGAEGKSLVAVKTDGGVFLSWEKTADKYEVIKNGEKIAVTGVTNYTDPIGKIGDVYEVAGESAAVWEKQYLEIPITAPEVKYNITDENTRMVTMTPAPAIGDSWCVYTNESGESVFVKDDGNVFDVNAQGKEPGTKVGTYGFNNGDNQKFIIEETAGGVLIKGKQSGLYLKAAADGGLTIENEGSVFKLTDSTAELTEKAENTIKALCGAVVYSANDAAAGDLDGDGEYEIVLKWDPSDSKDASNNGRTGKVYIDAYKLDGTRLWRIDMGENIRAGAHDTQMVVYDLDGDKKAEVVLRTADGTTDGVGTVIGDGSKVWTNNWAGKNLEGPLWLTVFNGSDGRAVTSVPYDPQSTEPSTLIFGDDFGNRSERYNACVAYIGGVPNVVTQRGYYGGRAGKGPGRTVIAAYTFDGKELKKTWRFDTMDPGNEKYIGQGNHNISVGDADGDGNDEIFCGALTLDDDGSVLWCSFMGHGDAMHLGDFDPEHPGLEFFAVHEGQTEAQKYGFTVFDAATGEILQAREAGKDTGRGLIANVGDFGGSYVAWAGSGAGKINSKGENLDLPFNSMNFRIYWDGDLYDELLDGTSIFKINEKGQQELIFNSAADGCASNNSSKSNPCLQADLFGDWREEVVWRTADNTALRIYTTTIPTEYSMDSLMKDHIYRMGIVWQNSSYNQPPHVGFYMTEGTRLTVGSNAANINGRKTEMDVAPVIIDDRTMVPVRFIAEAFGCAVDYDNGKVTIITPQGETIEMTIGESKYTVSGKELTMDTAPVIINDRTMVPVRFIAEALGKNVSWDNEEKTVTIKRGDNAAMTEAAKEHVKIFIAGDSTAQSYRENMAPQAGWGQMLPMFFDDSVTVENRAMAGRSLKSFFNEGRWKSILDDAEKGDYVVIQFGQNEGAYNKPERYISHEDFAKMLDEEYIRPALAKGLKVIIATQTQGRWFDEATGKIGEPGDGVSYASLLRDAAKEYGLPLLEINGLSRQLDNALGMEGSKKIHLYAEPGEYEKYPNGVSDNTHFSFTGAYEIARIAAKEMGKIEDLKNRMTDGCRKVAEVSGQADIDVRCWGLYGEFSVAVKSDGGEVKVNGVTVASGNVKEVVTRTASDKGFIHIEGSCTAEVSPIFNFAPEGGIDTAGGEYFLDLSDGTYDFTFTKSDNNRGNIYINGLLVGANVDMYGTVGVPEGTRYTFKGFTVSDGAKINVTEKTRRLKSVEAVPTPSIFERKTRVYVAGDSTLCNYYPVIPSVPESEIRPGEMRTGWGQVLEGFLSGDYEVINLASSGDWARDWRDAIFPTVMQNGQEGDYLIIQFGINDRNRDDKSKDTMKNALRDMVTECEKKGIIPILVKPQPSVGYSWGSAGDFEKPNGNNGGFFNCVKEVADEKGCIYVDLYGLAAEHFAEKGREFVSMNYQLWDYGKNEMSDKLHISRAGAKKMAELFSKDVGERGILKTREYMELTEVKDGLYTLTNGKEYRVINMTGEPKKAQISGAEIIIAPYSELMYNAD